MNFYFLWSPARSYQRLQTISSSNLSVPPAFSIPGRRERWVGGGRSLEKTSAGFKALIGGFVISFWALGCPINAFMSPALKDMTLDFSISCSSLTFGSRLSLFLLSRDLRSVEQESKKSRLWVLVTHAKACTFANLATSPEEKKEKKDCPVARL